MNRKTIKCMGCGLAFLVPIYSAVPYFLNCDDHWHCEPQEHIEIQSYSAPYPSAYQVAISAGISTSTTTLPPK